MKSPFPVLVVASLLASCATPAVQSPNAYPDGGVLHVTQDVKVVYGIEGDRARQGVGEGLFFVQRLVQNYENQGITPEDRSVVVVVYGEAAYWLLNDTAWSAANLTGALAGASNPHVELVAELLKNGVHIEVCGSTLKQKGWTREDLLPGVVVVPGAIARLVDLQLQGFAYIGFDRGTP